MNDLHVAKDRSARRMAIPASTVMRSGPSSASAALRRAIINLAYADADSPRLTAEVLLACVLGITRTQLLAQPERPIAFHALDQFDRLVARAAAGEPLAYLTGRREFYGLEFLVDPRVLIPRPETELLIDLARGLQSPAEVQASNLQFLDVGTGSGCLAVTLAVHFPSTHITALDVSADALSVARLNAGRHHVAGRITFLQSDLLSANPPQFRRPTSNLLCANLPYIPTGELRRLPVGRYEPALALDGGPDGLDLIRRLLAQVPHVMAPGSRLLLEIGATQGQTVAALARAAFPKGRVEVHQDLAGLDRVVEITL